MPQANGGIPTALRIGAAEERAASKPPQSVVDQVAAAILGMIMASELEPGTFVAIQDLSRQLGTSHVPIREALRRLEGRGLVVFRRGKRPQIAPIDARDFDNVFHLRTLIEKDVAERSATAIDEAQLQKLEATMAEFDRIFTHGSAFDVYEVHARFHLELLPGASDWDRRVLGQLLAASERYIQLYVGARPEPDVVHAIIASHWVLVEAARDIGRLPAAILSHIQDSVGLIRPTVIAMGDAAESGQTTRLR